MGQVPSVDPQEHARTIEEIVGGYTQNIRKWSMRQWGKELEELASAFEQAHADLLTRQAAFLEDPGNVENKAQALREVETIACGCEALMGLEEALCRKEGAKVRFIQGQVGRIKRKQVDPLLETTHAFQSLLEEYVANNFGS